jgi:hypothetical protein
MHNGVVMLSEAKHLYLSAAIVRSLQKKPEILRFAQNDNIQAPWTDPHWLINL